MGIVLATIVVAAAALAPAGEKTVLAIYPESRLLPLWGGLDTAIRLRLQRSTAPIHLLTEYVDPSWAGGVGSEDLIGRLLAEKYAGRAVDLLIACGDNSIDFVLHERASLFPNVPIVFCAADREKMLKADLPADVTGVTISVDWHGMVELALRLRPGTNRLVFISGANSTAREWEQQARRSLADVHGVQIDFLTGLPVPDLLKALAALPGGTAGIVNSFIRDGAGRAYTTPEVARMLAGVVEFPLYSFGATLMGAGIVGGPMMDFDEQGTHAADLAWRVLSGERPGPAGIVNATGSRWMFDARQLKRWEIPEDRLPPGSVIEFREVSIWRTYRLEIIAAIAFVALQTLLIAGLLLERRLRRRAERRLDERLRFETLLFDLAARFVDIRNGGVDRQIEDGLRRVGEVLALDRAGIADLASDGSFRITHSWVRADTPPAPAVVDAGRLPWMIGRAREGKVVPVSRVEDLPEDAVADRRTLATLGIRSTIFVPYALDGVISGALACTMLRSERPWPDELVTRLRHLGETFAVVLMRRRAHTALEESERRFRQMADAAPVMIWTAGADGRCVDFNRAWLEFTGRLLAQELGDGWVEGIHPDDRARVVSAWREAVADRRSFAQEYRLRRADGAWRSVLCHGSPRFGGSGEFLGYVGSDTDLTDLKQTEEALARGRDDLAHALRVATLGELAATFAHEMNQPLTAILSNAQAGERLLKAPRFSRPRFIESLQDIANDARRAGEVIKRLRTLFRKAQPDRRPVDLNEAIGEVTALLRKDLEWRGVALELDLAKPLPRVMGDMVQLQQVILNLVINACEAMNNAGDGRRELRIKTGRNEGQHVEVLFRDSGAGVKDGELERIFERFVTTKKDGLGMGLAISRSIIEAHGGRIWATRNDDRGLTIHGELPALPS